MDETKTAGLYLGLDVGTQSTKGLLLDVDDEGKAKIVGRAARAYDLMPSAEPGCAEQHPHTWRDAVSAVLKELAAARPLEALRGIGVSGQQHGSVFLDEAGEVVRAAKLWCDTTTADEASEISAQSPYPVPSGFTLPKVLWLKRHEPENWARVKTLLLPHDYINFLLTGERYMEAGDASGTGAFDPQTRSWNRALLDWVDPELFGMLPPLVAADARHTVSRGGAELFGLPEGAIVSPGGGDNMMSAIGAGATGPGATVISLGTSGTAFAYSQAAILDTSGAIAPFCDSTGAYLPLLCTMNVTGVTELVRGSYGNPSLESLTQLASAIAPGADGLSMLPYVQGERVPNLPDATGALLGIRPHNFTPGHVFRAALEATALGLVSGVERMKELGLALTEVNVVGGGSKNPLWRQILADALGVPVRRVVEPESAALGGALQALWVRRRQTQPDLAIAEVCAPIVELAPERHEPNAAHYELYQQKLHALRQNTDALFGKPA